MAALILEGSSTGTMRAMHVGAANAPTTTIGLGIAKSVFSSALH
jgi:hypothetical protein